MARSELEKWGVCFHKSLPLVEPLIETTRNLDRDIHEVLGMEGGGSCNADKYLKLGTLHDQAHDNLISSLKASHYEQTLLKRAKNVAPLLEEGTLQELSKKASQTHVRITESLVTLLATNHALPEGTQRLNILHSPIEQLMFFSSFLSEGQLREYIANSAIHGNQSILSTETAKELYDLIIR